MALNLKRLHESDKRYTQLKKERRAFMYKEVNMTCQTCNTFFSKSPYLRVGEQHVIKDGKIIHAKYKYYSPITKKSHWRVVYACR